MASRSSALLCVGVLLAVAGSQAKPFLGGLLLCDLMCDDDDYGPSTSTSSEYYEDWCVGCPRRRNLTTPRPPAGLPPPPINLLLGPSPMNLTMIPVNGTWMVNYLPGGPGGPVPPGFVPVPPGFVPVPPGFVPFPGPVPSNSEPVPAVMPAPATPAPAATTSTATTPTTTKSTSPASTASSSAASTNGTTTTAAPTTKK